MREKNLVATTMLMTVMIIADRGARRARGGACCCTRTLPCWPRTPDLTSVGGGSTCFPSVNGFPYPRRWTDARVCTAGGGTKARKVSKQARAYIHTRPYTHFQSKACVVAALILPPPARANRSFAGNATQPIREDRMEDVNYNGGSYSGGLPLLERAFLLVRQSIGGRRLHLHLT